MLFYQAYKRHTKKIFPQILCGSETKLQPIFENNKNNFFFKLASRLQDNVKIINLCLEFEPKLLQTVL